jgi:hypothetical protein
MHIRRGSRGFRPPFGLAMLFFSRSIALLVNCEEQPTPLIHNTPLYLFDSPQIELCRITQMRIAPTTVEADMGSPSMLTK